MPETEKAHSKEAMAIAHPLCRHYSCDWVGTKKQEAECSEQCCLNIAAALDAFAAERVALYRREYSRALRLTRGTVIALRARNEKLAVLASIWESQARGYPSPEGDTAAAAVRLCAKELRDAAGEDADETNT